MSIDTLQTCLTSFSLFNLNLNTELFFLLFIYLFIFSKGRKRISGLVFGKIKKNVISFISNMFIIHAGERFSGKLFSL